MLKEADDVVGEEGIGINARMIGLFCHFISATAL